MKKTTIIAEAGIGAANDFNKLLDMAVVAKASKADYMKIQKRVPRLSVPKHMWDVPKKTPWGPTLPYIEYKEAMEFSVDQLKELDRFCKEIKLQWSTSVWDIPSLEDMVGNFDLPWLKIPSAHLTNTELVKESAKWSKLTNRPLIISTGMSTEEEIDECYKAVKDVLQISTNDLLVLMKCHSKYPSTVDEANLGCIPYMKEKYGCRVGFSSHDELLITKCAAIYLGAEFVEAHFTLDREGGGTDDLASLSSWGLAKVVDGIRKLERAYGDGILRVYSSELPNRKKLRGV